MRVLHSELSNLYYASDLGLLHRVHQRHRRADRAVGPVVPAARTGTAVRLGFRQLLGRGRLHSVLPRVSYHHQRNQSRCPTGALYLRQYCAPPRSYRFYFQPLFRTFSHFWR